jgi:carboxymethylenebutenolidase
LAPASPALRPSDPLDLAARLKAPVLGLYGGQDDGIPLDSVTRMQRALKAAGGRSAIVVFPDAPHGFHADYRPSFRAREAAEGWQRLLDWLRANGVA